MIGVFSRAWKTIANLSLIFFKIPTCIFPISQTLFLNFLLVANLFPNSFVAWYIYAITSWVMWYYLLCMPLVVSLFVVTNSSLIKQCGSNLFTFLLSVCCKSSPNFAQEHVKSTTYIHVCIYVCKEIILFTFAQDLRGRLIINFLTLQKVTMH